SQSLLQALSSSARRLRGTIPILLHRHRELVDMLSQPLARQAISLKDVLEHPEKYRGETIRIAVTDVDGTTRAGYLAIEWFIKEVLRYGPMAVGGISWWRLIWAL